MELTPKKFASLLKKQPPQVVLFYGPEYSLMKRALNRLIDAWNARDGVRDFSGRELSFERFSEEVVSNLLFCPKKVVVVREAFAFFKGLKSHEKRGLKRLLEGLDGNTCVVFVESSEIDSKYRKNQMVSLVDDVGVVVLCRRGDEREIRAWLKRKLVKYGLYDESFVDFLVDISGGSFDVLEKELEKLLVSFDREAVSGSKAYSPFELVDLALFGSSEAFDALDYLFSTGFSPIFLLVLFQNTVRKIIAVKKGMEVSPYEKRRLAGCADLFSEGELLLILSKLFDAEFKLKTTGVPPRFVWEDFLFFLIFELKPAERRKAGQVF